MKEPILLSPEITIQVWQSWLRDVEGCELLAPTAPRYASRVLRNRFDSWLWDYGGSIRLINKKYHISAYESDATMIVLRWT